MAFYLSANGTFESQTSFPDLNTSLYEDNIDVYVPSENDFLPEVFPASLRIFLAVVYSAVSVMAMLGNVGVLFVILCHPALRTITNTFILSLTVSDTLIAAWTVPLQLLYYLRNEWVLGEAMCKVTSFVQGVSILSSILALAAISLERYLTDFI